MPKEAPIIFCGYDGPGIVSGPNSWFCRLLPDLSAKGLDIRALFIHSGAEEKCPTIQCLKNSNVIVSTLQSNAQTFHREKVRWILEQARSIKPRVFVPNLMIPAYYASSYIRKSGAHTIGVIHSDDEFHQAMIRHFATAPTSPTLDSLVVVSSFLQTSISTALEQSSSLDPIRIPCGSPVPAETRVRAKSDELRLLYAGRLVEKQKRISDLTRAFQRAADAIPQTFFSIYGDGPCRDSVSGILANSSAPVILHGAIPPEDMQKEMLKHDVFVLLSDYEGLPIALLEAMACGLVPVCLRTESGIAEVIRHNENGLIVEDRDENFIDAIRYLQQSPQDWRRMAAKARETVESEFSSQINHEKWYQLLTNSIADSSEPTAIRVPWKLSLPPADPAFRGEDQLRPPWQARFNTWRRDRVFRFRQTLRPRARLRKLLRRERN